MSVLKVNIDTKDLINLLGDESEVSVKLREGIANEFAKKYLKSLVKTAIESEAPRTLKAELEDAVKAKNRLWGTRFGAILKAEYAKDIHDIVKEEFRACVAEAAREEVQKIREEIEASVARQVTRYDAQIEGLFQQDVEDHIEKEVSRRLDLIVKGIREKASEE